MYVRDRERERPANTQTCTALNVERWEGEETDQAKDETVDRLQQTQRSPRVQSTALFNCSSVMKMSIVVGWSRVHAGTQPLNMNIAPSLRIDCRIICSVDLLSAPDALMIRLFSTSAGEHTVVATVPCH